MNISEISREGAERYVTTLRGPLDGCRFESLYWPDGKMKVSLLNGDGEAVARVEMQVDSIQELGEEYLLMKPSEDEIETSDMVWDGSDLSLVEGSHRGELLSLAAWWLTSNVAPIVSLGGSLKKFKRGGDWMRLLESQVLGESQMEAFYGGDLVPLHDGLWVQSTCVKVYAELMPGQEVVKQVKDDYWRVETLMSDDNGYVGMIQGSVFLIANGDHRLVIDYWESNWESDDLKPDLLALVLRFMMSKFDNIKIVQDPMVIEVDEEEVSERTSFWLGF